MVGIEPVQEIGGHLSAFQRARPFTCEQDKHSQRIESDAAEATSPERLPEVEVGDGGAVKLFALRLVAHRTSDPLRSRLQYFQY